MIGNHHRRAIVLFLRDNGAMTIHQMESLLNKKQPFISGRVKELMDAGILEYAPQQKLEKHNRLYWIAVKFRPVVETIVDVDAMLEGVSPKLNNLKKQKLANGVEMAFNDEPG